MSNGMDRSALRKGDNAGATSAQGTAGAKGTVNLEIPLDRISVTAPLPEMLSQRNVESVVGISKRVYLETLRTPGFPLKVATIGRLKLVNRVEFMTWLYTQSVKKQPANDTKDTKDAGREGVISEIEAELRAGRGRR